jgi:V8-like Glu-specific endopeptidase
VFGTGFLIAPSLVLTAYHVVEAAIRAGTGNIVCRFDYRTLPDGSREPSRAYALAGTEARDGAELTNSDWLADSSPNARDEAESDRTDDRLDHAVLRLRAEAGREPIVQTNSSIAVERGWFRMPRRPPKTDPGTQFFILHYPEGRPLVVSTGTIIAVDATRTHIRHEAETFPGSAGAPCVSAAGELIGMHQSGRTSDDGRRFESQALSVEAITIRLESAGLSSMLEGDVAP